YVGIASRHASCGAVMTRVLEAAVVQSSLRMIPGHRQLLGVYCMGTCVLGATAAVSWSFFFFFQAEDGIRDATVTGVQTCALPILGLEPPFALIDGQPIRGATIVQIVPNERQSTHLLANRVHKPYPVADLDDDAASL